LVISSLVNASSFWVSSIRLPLILNGNKSCGSVSLLPKQNFTFFGGYLIR
jgi:hypothetical protein